ncbi:MAG: hypothetical protein BAJATHORv1_170001, partial [Candidatus Thorarchaeota archaeon]
MELSQVVRAVPQLAHQRQGDGVVPLLHAGDEALRHTDDLGVDDQLLVALAALEVHHAGPGDHVDTDQGRHQGAAGGLEAALGVDDLGVAHPQVGVGRHVERLAHLGVGAIDHPGTDSAHRRGPLAHVEGRRRPAPDDGGAFLGQLADGHPAHALGGVLHHSAGDGDRGRGTGQGHGDQLRGDPVTGAVDHVLAGQIAPQERRRGADVEDGDRLLSQRLFPTGHRGQHVLHRPPGVLAEGTGDDRLPHVVEGDVEPVEVTDLLRHVGADQGRALGIDLGQRLHQLDELDEVGRDRRSLLLGLAIEDRDGRRAGIELDAVAAVVDHRLAVQVVEVKLRGRGLQGTFDDLPGNVGDLGLEIDLGPCIGQQLQRLLVMDTHTGVHQQLESLRDDLLSQLLAQDR